MRLKKSCSDTDRMYVDCDRKENESLRGKIVELDELIDNIHCRVGEIVFDELNVLLNSADVDLSGLIYPEPGDPNPDVTKLGIAIEDQSSGGYLYFDFSFHDLVSESMELIKDCDKERVMEFAKQLRIIADEIEDNIKNIGND